MTPAEIQILIETKLADASAITAEKHRDVETALLNYIKTKPSVKILTIDSFTTDKNYSVNTGLVAGSTITGVIVALECTGATDSFVIGDIVTAPTPYPADSGRTSAQGIGVQYNSNTSTVKVMVNDQLTIMTAYNPASGAIANNVTFSGSGCANWKIKLYVNYLDA
jgi:hypothetical protein